MSQMGARASAGTDAGSALGEYNVVQEIILYVHDEKQL
jgi:hypothetical protein